MVRQEIIEICLAPTAAVDLQRDQSGSKLDPANQVERSMLIPIGNPGQHFRIGERGLGLCNRMAADPVQHQFMPQFVGQGQLFAGGLFTSLTALSRTMPRAESRLTASSNGSSSVPSLPSMIEAAR